MAGYPAKRKFHPKNPHKYVGNVDNIIARSRLEERFMRFFDQQDSVLKWASEEMCVPYVSNVDTDPNGKKKVRRYFPDFVIQVREKTGALKTYMVEIKPKSQTVQPKRRKVTNKYIKELQVFQRNQDKWAAAEKFCKEKNMGFIILHEDHLKHDWK